MDIDLFLSKSGQCGLMCQGSFKEPPAGILFDAQTMEITAEFINQDPLHLNINVDDAMKSSLLDSKHIYLGVIFDGVMNETLDMPLFILNNPYSDGHNTLDKSAQTTRNVRGFDSFIKNSKFAQAIHREDLENEATSQSVLHDQNLQALAYSPLLQRQMKLEAAPQVVAAPMALPSAGLGGGVNSSPSLKQQPKPPSTKSTNKDD